MVIFRQLQRIHTIFKKPYEWARDNFLLIMAVLVILPLIVISGFVHPVGDDFSYANASNLGFIELEKYFYLRMGGRFTHNFLYAFSLLPDPPVTVPLSWESLIPYRVFPIVIIILMVISLCHLMGSLFVSAKYSQRIWIALGLLIAFLSFRHPSSIYWYSGAVPYGLGMSSVTLFISMLIRFSEKPDGIRYLLVSATGVFSVGLNESALVVIDFVLFVVCVYMFATSNRNRYKLLALLGTMVFFSLISIFAPGNMVRDQRASFEREKDLFFAIFKSIDRGFANSLYWFTVSALVNLLLVDYIRRKGLTLKSMLARIDGKGVLAMTVACVLLCYFPNAWARGGTNPDYRVVDFIHYLFVTGFFLYFAHLALKKDTARHEGEAFPISNPLRHVLMWSLVCTLYVATDLKTHVKDLFVKAPAFDREMMERYRIIASSTADTVIVPTVKNLPITIYFDDIQVDPRNWRNLNYSQYFNKKHIRLASENRYLETLHRME